MGHDALISLAYIWHDACRFSRFPAPELNHPWRHLSFAMTKTAPCVPQQDKEMISLSPGTTAAATGRPGILGIECGMVHSLHRPATLHALLPWRIRLPHYNPVYVYAQALLPSGAAQDSPARTLVSSGQGKLPDRMEYPSDQ